MDQIDSTPPPELKWIPNTEKYGREFMDGQIFLIAVPVRNNETKAEYWNIDKVQMDCGGEECVMRYYGSGDLYDAWEWPDIEFYIEMTE